MLVSQFVPALPRNQPIDQSSPDRCDVHSRFEMSVKLSIDPFLPSIGRCLLELQCSTSSTELVTGEVRGVVGGCKPVNQILVVLSYCWICISSRLLRGGSVVAVSSWRFLLRMCKHHALSWGLLYESSIRYPFPTPILPPLHFFSLLLFHPNSFSVNDKQTHGRHKTLEFLRRWSTAAWGGWCLSRYFILWVNSFHVPHFFPCTAN